MAALDLNDLYQRAQEDRLLELLMDESITALQGFLVKRVQLTESGC